MFQRVLLAVDRSESGRVAASHAGGLARTTGGVVRVLYVNELLTGRGLARSTNREAAEVVTAAIEAVVEAGSRADGVVRVATGGDVAATIASTAAEWGADVVVLGSRRRPRRRHGLGRLARAGVRGRVTALTSLPTLTAPPPLDVDRVALAVLEAPSLAGSGTGH